MFSEMIKSLPCEACEFGKLHYSQRDTFEAWQDSNIFRLDDLPNLIDGVINEVLVFACDRCEAKYRYTFKEIEKIFRKKLSDRLLTMIATGDIPDPGSFNNTNRIIVYCGKCGGMDGKGSCPKVVYEKCELKRLPKNAF